MDNKTRFTKTAKGSAEALGKTKTLPREYRRVIREVDGHASFYDLRQILTHFSDTKLSEILQKLVVGEYIRGFNLTESAAIDESEIPAEAELENALSILTMGAFLREVEQQPPAPDHSHSEELAGGTDSGQVAGILAAQAQARAQQKLAELAKVQAASKAKLIAEEKLRQKQQAQATKEAAELAKRQFVQEQAQLAIIQQAQDLKAAEEAALGDAELRAAEQEQSRKLEQERKEAEERSRQTLLAKTKREAEQLALEQALAAALQEAEQRARLEAERALLAIQQLAENEEQQQAQRKAQQESLEMARLEAEESAKAKAHAEEEAAAMALRAALEQERKIAEQMQAERKAKKRAANQEQARRTAEQHEKKRIESQKKHLAEEQQKQARAQAKADELTKLAAQAQAVAAEQAQLAIEASMRQEAEALAFALAQTQEQKNREGQASHAADDQLKRDAEAQAQSEIDAQALKAVQAELDRQAAQKNKEREERERAEQSAALAVQERLQLAQAQALDRAEERAADIARKQRERKKRLAKEQSSLASRKEREISANADQVSYHRSGSWLQLFLGAALLVSIAMLAWAQLSDFSARLTQFEKFSSAQLQQVVKIGDLHFSFFPQPHWKLENVSIGERAQIKIAQVNAFIDVRVLLAQEMQITGLEFLSPVLNQESLGWLLFGKPQNSGTKMRYFSASNLSVDWPELKLGTYELSGEFGMSGAWQNMKLLANEQAMQIELQVKTGTLQVKLNAQNFAVPFGSELKLSEFSAEGSLAADALNLNKFYGVIHDGTLTGTARLAWGERWSLTGDAHGKQINAALALPAIFENAKLDGHARFSMQAQSAGQLFDAARMNGNLQIHGGSLLGVNLLNLMQAGEVGGKSAFNDLVSGFSYDVAKTYFRNIKLMAGLVSAYGSADLNKNENINGHFAVLLSSPIREARSDLLLTGTLKKPRFMRASAANSLPPSLTTDAALELE